MQIPNEICLFHARLLKSHPLNWEAVTAAFFCLPLQTPGRETLIAVPLSPYTAMTEAIPGGELGIPAEGTAIGEEGTPEEQAPGLSRSAQEVRLNIRHQRGMPHV